MMMNTGEDGGAGRAWRRVERCVAERSRRAAGERSGLGSARDDPRRGVRGECLQRLEHESGLVACAESALRGGAGAEKKPAGVRGSAVRQGAWTLMLGLSFASVASDKWHRERDPDGAACMCGVIRGMPHAAEWAAARSRARRSRLRDGPLVDAHMPFAWCVRGTRVAVGWSTHVWSARIEGCHCAWSRSRI